MNISQGQNDYLRSHRCAWHSKNHWRYRVYAVFSGEQSWVPVAFAETASGASKSAERLAARHGDVHIVLPCSGCHSDSSGTIHNPSQ